MSRIANRPLEIPANVKFAEKDNQLSIEGPKGKFQHQLHPSVKVEKIDDKTYKFSAKDSNNVQLNQIATSRVIVGNMVEGVNNGFSKKLNLIGVGYRAKMAGKNLELSLGYSHPITYVPREGITINCPSNTEIEVSGASKQDVGQTAAEIREFRKPEPYKGKGVRLSDEIVIRKEAKKKAK